MTSVNHLKIKEELLNLIRNSNVISKAIRGVTTQTDTFSGNNTATEFTLTKSGIKNIRSVSVGGTELTPLVDYTYTLVDNDDTNKIISFTLTPATGTDNISIEYDYSSTGDKIYDDYSMYTIKNEDKFPRIAFDIVSENTEDKALQGAIYQSNVLITFSVFGRGKNETEELLEDLTNYLISQKLSSNRLNYLAIRGKSRMDVWLEGKTYKIFKKSVDFSAPYEFYV